tara:strand:+ start:177 stop:389 length:213 start_codon:yes stop_codon:yes gene_type:complete
MQFKNNTKQRSASIQGLRSFKDTLPKNVKKIINKKGHVYSETLNNWKYLVGNELFKVCYQRHSKTQINLV